MQKLVLSKRDRALQSYRQDLIFYAFFMIIAEDLSPQKPIRKLQKPNDTLR